MPKNREKVKANKRKEALIDKRNAWGHRDDTPFQAIKHIRAKQLEERRSV